MAQVVLMPQAGQTMTEGKIVQWFVQEGDSIRQGDPLLEIETDKANMDVEAPGNGVLRKVFHREGETVPVLSVVGVVGGAEETIDFEALRVGGATDDAPGPNAAAPTNGDSASAVAASPAPERPPRPVPSTPEVARAAVSATVGRLGGRLRASPLARRVAKLRGVDLRSLRGSGPNGRIIRRDVDAAELAPPSIAPPRGASGGPPIATPAPVAATPPSYPDPSPRPAASVPITGMRKAIADGLQRSKVQAPHFYVSMDIDVTGALAYRETLRERGLKVSVNDLVIVAAATALTDEPRVNCRVHEGHIEYPSEVNIGVAVGLDEGLVVPVVLRANEKNLRGVTEECRRLVESARQGKLVGVGQGTFTISNLGMFGVDAFTAVINPPEGAILAVGAATPRLVPRDGGFFPRTIMTATLSADHRAIDGVLAARFLARVRYLLENPSRLV